MNPRFKSMHRKAGLLLLLAALGASAADSPPREPAELFAAGRYEEALARLEQLARDDPQNLAHRTQLISRREEAVQRLLSEGTMELDASRADKADAIFRRVLRLEPANERAQQGVIAAARLVRNNELLAQAREAVRRGETEKAQALLQSVSLEYANNRELADIRRSLNELPSTEALTSPTLKAAFKEPVSLEFRDANLKMVFEALSRSTDINFILDREIKADQKTTLFLKKSTLEDAVDMLLITNQLEKKVLNANSVLIYPSTPAKIKEYQDLIVKTFYLENADVKQTLNMIKTMLKTKDVYVDERLNLMVMRDTPEVIRLAEKLIGMQDMSEPEVMLEVEVLEIKRSRLLDLGINYPNQLTLSPLPSSIASSTIVGPGGTTLTNPTNGPLTLADLRSLNSSRLGAAISPLVINLKKEDGTVNLLANPRIRARNREKAKILIGDKVPVITTTSTATGFVAESVQYVDVGLKLEVEPNIYLLDDVAIKVSLEVSSIVRELRSSSGSLSYQIGTRNVSTVLRLKDGETQVLAGLISDEARASASKIPGLGDLPVLGRLFSNHSDESQKTEIVLSITPRLVRNLKRPGADEFWSGTDAAFRTRPLSLVPVADSSTGKSGAVSIVASAAAGGPAATGAAPGASFSWDSPVQVRTGQLFRAALRVKAEGNVGALPFQLGYDPRSLEVVDVREGDFFKRGGVNGNFTSSVDPLTGKVTVDTSSPDADGAKGEGTLVNITFKALAPLPKAEIKLLSVSGTALVLPDPHVFSISRN
jgi:general secretion pathway protein D